MFPEIYDPQRIGRLFYPDAERIALNAEAAGLSPADQDPTRRLLLIIDMQIDFCHPNGSLYVPGAEQDVRRTIEFIYTHASKITHITCTLDSHFPFQIFHAAWWEDEKGKHPPPYTGISAEDVMSRRWRPLRYPEWSVKYVQLLERDAKKRLLIWPYHVPLGGLGHALDPELWSAVFWHAVARKAEPTWWMKGDLPQTEHYSILRPEVEVPDHARSSLGNDFIAAVEDYDQVFIAGEAETHCVLESVEDLVDIFHDRPDVLKKLFILRDCTSPVRHPEIDFHAMAQSQFERYAQMGVQFINSTDQGVI
jgi:nicotinamidase/pyrazinamidase